MGFYVWGDHFVCIRDNTKLAPNHIFQIKTHWNNAINPIFDNHISYISERKEDKKVSFITKQEAEYILEKLENKDTQDIIMNSQDSRSISSRLPINIPLFAHLS